MEDEYSGTDAAPRRAAPRVGCSTGGVGCSTRASLRRPLYEGRFTRVAPRGSLHQLVADLFYTNVRSIWMVLWRVSKGTDGDMAMVDSDGGGYDSDLGF